MIVSPLSPKGEPLSLSLLKLIMRNHTKSTQQRWHICTTGLSKFKAILMMLYIDQSFTD